MERIDRRDTVAMPEHITVLDVCVDTIDVLQDSIKSGCCSLHSLHKLA